jgi:hypothetical protein
MFSSRKYGTLCPYCNLETANKTNITQKELSIEEELLEEYIEPVCGWLVCIEGAKVGKDFKVRAGKNFIGRSEDMDIQILGDDKISRRNHSIVVYDSKKKNFVLLPGDSQGLTYLNNNAVYVPIDLSPYDVIELGNSKFLFISLCGKQFEWDDVQGKK